MNYKDELKALELIQSIPEPPYLPVIFTFSDSNYTKVSDQLIEYFKKLNIEVKREEPTDKIKGLLKKYGIEPFEVKFVVIKKHEI